MAVGALITIMSAMSLVALLAIITVMVFGGPFLFYELKFNPISACGGL